MTINGWSLFAVAAGLGWASGLRFYAVCFVLGLLGRYEFVELPGQLSYLAHHWLLIGSGVLCFCEFLADKVPAFDSLWDALHTFVRGPGGALLAALAVQGQTNELSQALIALFAGSLATLTHLSKASTRVAINHSPEPFSNFIASAGEDVASMGILWLAWHNPWLFFASLSVFVALIIWLLPKLWLFVKNLLSRMRGIKLPISHPD
jgi:Domain of unknown function (DUF4126)